MSKTKCKLSMPEKPVSLSLTRNGIFSPLTTPPVLASGVKLLLLMALLLKKASASGLEKLFFTDLTGVTFYTLHATTDSYIWEYETPPSQQLQNCNASLVAPFTAKFVNIADTQVARDAGGDSAALFPVESFFRAENNISQPIFENCIRSQMEGKFYSPAFFIFQAILALLFVAMIGYVAFAYAIPKLTPKLKSCYERLRQLSQKQDDESTLAAEERVSLTSYP